MKKFILFLSGYTVRYITVFLVLFSISGTMFAQGISIKGEVISKANNLPLIGAFVVQKGTKNGVLTDINGKFAINVPSNASLEISYIGYVTKIIKINPKKNFYKIFVNEDKTLLEQAVVVGYGTMKRKEVTGSVAQVTSKDLNQIATSDVGNALQGQIAGVNVSASSGEPGSESNIIIRGISSISGSNEPLWVVDGVPYEGNPGLSSDEISSIDVLKDAASAAIYGTRGAAGVILVTTKKGKVGEMSVKFDGYYGIQHITSSIDKVDAAEYMYLKLVAGRLGTSNFTDDRIWTNLETYPNNFTRDSDLNKVVQNDNAPIQNYALNLSGGQKNLTYNINGSYFNQEGVIINTGYERYNIRASAHMVKKKFTFDTSLSAKFDKKDSPGYNLLAQSYTQSPLSASIDPNASITTTDAEGGELNSMANMLARIKEHSTRNSESVSVNASGKYNFLKNLYISSRISASRSNSLNKKINPLFELYDSEGSLYSNSNTRSAITETSARNTSLSWETQGHWNLKFGKKHALNLTAVYSMEKYTYSQFYAKKYDLISSDVTVLNGAQNDASVGSGTGQWGQDKTNTLIGVLGRMQYNYAGKYMLTASIRRDGSSKFAAKNRWGLFPSVAAAWNISDENFWKRYKKVVNNFKLRTSYGTTGNQNFIDYATLPTINTGYDYSFGDESTASIQRGATQTVYSNADVKWETTTMYNFGIDMAMFHNKLTMSVDAYKSFKKDMLFPLLLPRSTGVDNPYTLIMNMGDMTNTGIEVSTGIKGNIEKLWYSVNVTYSHNQNKVTKMSGTNKISYFSNGYACGNTNPVTVLKEGDEAGSFYVLPTNGIANTEQKLVEYQKLRPSAKMGDLMYVDKNGDGQLDDGDRINAGSGTPKHELGLNTNFSYKNFDLSSRWYAALGNKIINGTDIYMYQYSTHKDLLYAWSEKNPTGVVPRYYNVKSHYNYAENTDLWVQDGSYLRLKNVSLGYKLPTKMVKRMGLSKLRFYLSADNLLTLTKYDGNDPEVGNNGLSTRGLDFCRYPISRQVRFGIQLQF